MGNAVLSQSRIKQSNVSVSVFTSLERPTDHATERVYHCTASTVGQEQQNPLLKHVTNGMFHYQRHATAFFPFYGAAASNHCTVVFHHERCC